MLANIRQHAAYIASTIGYIDDQIVEDTRIVTEASVSFFTSSVLRRCAYLIAFIQCL